MKLHNTLTKKVDEFAPIDGKNARIYSCGPTVYNHAHIGNLSSYIYADILRRAVNLAGFSTEHVMNFTDVDDKTIRDSRANFPDLDPMAALEKLTRHYEKIFLNEMAQVGNDVSKIKFVRATENIAEIQDLIRKLLDLGVAYVADDGIYFSIAEYRKARKYGQLSTIELPAEMQSRIDNDEYDKASAQDFALWKRAKDGEPSWEFEIDADASQLCSRDSVDATKLSDKIGEKEAIISMLGRPGWHIECSVMSVKNLGQPFDIHTGGVDLIFPHHENEIAQSTAGDQPETYAKFFVHNEHLLVDGKKMSKSAHNFYTLPDIIKKGFSPLDFRMLVLQSHYRSATNFSWENLEAAKNRLKRWRNVAELRWQNCLDGADFSDPLNYLVLAGDDLLNDLDTPNALKNLDQFIENVNATNYYNNIENFIKFVDENLGLDLYNTTPDITNEQKNFIKLRETARVEKNWTESDRLRDILKSQGIVLRDEGEMTIWLRV
ncbi:MAG: hypothetical protein LBM09_02550 [Candidatus Nomurabacteria bacterium]|jgi:cysteinyl-tRNA synthetase|nr:hypothetical protein [Candidatus Nomurabacteria bacterium]